MNSKQSNKLAKENENLKELLKGALELAEEFKRECDYLEDKCKGGHGNERD